MRDWISEEEEATASEWSLWNVAEVFIVALGYASFFWASAKAAVGWA